MSSGSTPGSVARLVRRMPSGIVVPVLLSSLGVLIIAGATSQGLGVSPDSVHYLGAAGSLVEGRGLKVPIGSSLGADYRDFVYWPPLYPFLVATIAVWGPSPHEAARLLAFLFYPLVLVAFHFLVVRAWGSCARGALVGFIASLMVGIMSAMVYISAFAWTELVFLFFVCTSLLAFLMAEGQVSVRPWAIAAVPVALACLTRYLGLALVVVGVLTIISLRNPLNQLRHRVHALLAFLVISTVPIGLWMIRNILLSGFPTGMERASPGFQGFTANILDLVKAFIDDMLPRPSLGLGVMSFIRQAALPVLLGSILLVAVCLARKRPSLVRLRSAGSRAIQRISRSLVGGKPIVLFVAVYAVALCGTRAHYESDIIATRLASPLYAPGILVAVLLAARPWLCPSVRTLRASSFMVLSLAVVVFLGVHVVNTSRFLEKLPDRLQYNSPAWIEDEAIAYLRSNAPGDTSVYSNFADALSFLLRRPIRWVPSRSGDITSWVERLQADRTGNILVLYAFNAKERPLLSKQDLDSGYLNIDGYKIHLNGTRSLVFSIPRLMLRSA